MGKKSKILPHMLPWKSHLRKKNVFLKKLADKVIYLYNILSNLENCWAKKQKRHSLKRGNGRGKTEKSGNPAEKLLKLIKNDLTDKNNKSIYHSIALSVLNSILKSVYKHSAEKYNGLKRKFRIFVCLKSCYLWKKKCYLSLFFYYI